MQPAIKDMTRFWQWFQQNQSQFVHWGELNAGEWHYYFDTLEQLLHSCCPNIRFIIEANEQSTPGRIIITADGDPDYFEFVLSLVDAAPDLPGWEIIAFRSMAPLDYLADLDELNIQPRALWFCPIEMDDIFVGVRIFIPYFNYKRQSEYLDSIRNMLMNLMGEQNFGYHIFQVELVNLPFTKKVPGLRPFTDIAGYVLLQ
jgi:hypothetical protein